MIAIADRNNCSHGPTVVATERAPSSRCCCNQPNSVEVGTERIIFLNGTNAPTQSRGWNCAMDGIPLVERQWSPASKQKP